MGNQYVILNDKKQATHTFAAEKGGGKKWNEVKEFDNIGLIIPKPYIVLDFDTTSDADIMLRIVEELDLKCRVMKTTRGIHVWFKSEEAWKCFKKTRLAIGIYSDCKSHSANAYVKIKENGNERQWIRKCPMDEIEEVPKWLYPISSPNDKFKFKGMSEGDGRNQELFNYIVYLQSKGFTRDEVKDTIQIINAFVFEDELDDEEIKQICRDEAFKPDEEIKAQLEEKEKKLGFKHNEFGDDLIEAYHILTKNGRMYVYEDNYYQQDERIIERKMIELYPSIKTKDRTEVLNYIKIMTHIRSKQIPILPYVINLNNTRLDIRNSQALPFTPEAVEFQRIPVTYDPSAYCADVDKMLNKIFCGDREVMMLFDEMLGSCLIKHARYQKAFMLYGSGSNGKSTLMAMINALLGDENIANIPLEKLTEKFAAAELEDKIANIGDDINNSFVKESGTLKKLFAGGKMQVERKNERPFDMASYATNIFTANDLPPSTDKTYGFYRRWCFIPMKAVITVDDDDYDPMIEDKVTTPQALSYLLNRAIKGAQRLIRTGHYTQPEIVKQALQRYETDNSTTLTWIAEESIDLEYIVETSTAEIYATFRDWCINEAGIQKGNVTGKKTFNKELITHFNLEEKQKQRTDGKRYFSLNLDD